MPIMNMLRRMAVTTFIVCLSAGTFFVKESSAAPRIFDAKPGHYMFDKYVDRIKAKEGPCAAYNALEYGDIEVIIRKEKDRISIALSTFHEGDTAFTVDKNGKFKKVNTMGDFADEPLTLNRDGSLTLHYRKKPARRFVYIRDPEAFVANEVLVGDYVDSAGKKVSFGKDGMAALGTEKFPYSLNLDCEGWSSVYGLFYDLKTHDSFVFDVKGSSLTVHRIVDYGGGDLPSPEDNPFISAVKVTR